MKATLSSIPTRRIPGTLSSARQRWQCVVLTGLWLASEGVNPSTGQDLRSESSDKSPHSERSRTFGMSLGLLTVLFFIMPSAFSQGTAFTYQGRLNDNGAPANGNYGMMFYLCDTPASGGQLANLGIVNVPVSNGLFTVTLDFGANFPGADRW